MSEFESSVDSEGSKTAVHAVVVALPFESSVDSEGSKTDTKSGMDASQFESSVDSEGSKTGDSIHPFCCGLRAV